MADILMQPAVPKNVKENIYLKTVKIKSVAD
jgi:hypothetical protein